MPLFTANRKSHVKQNVKVPDPHESFPELTENGRKKIFREKLSDGLYTENTLATKMPEKGLQPCLGTKIHRTAL